VTSHDYYVVTVMFPSELQPMLQSSKRRQRLGKSQQLRSKLMDNFNDPQPTRSRDGFDLPPLG